MRCTRQKTFLTIVVLLCFCYAADAQFAPAADLAGTTAIYKDSSAFTAWATGCTVQRGPVNIANPALGPASAGDSAAAIGMAGENGTVSLGDGGTAVLTFAQPIYNGTGFDFAVFENGFMVNDSNLAFLELAFVEVSTDGLRYVRFPATTEVQDTFQLNNDGAIDCSQLYNLAGKYIANYGTPFDLNELVDSPGIDINNINYVKVIDVVGSIDSAYATRDHNGHIINDPWPTPFASCGFDLDAVGVIHAKGLTGIKNVADGAVKAYPDPVYRGNEVSIQSNQNILGLKIYDVNGRLVHQFAANTSTNRQSINTDGFNSGIYFITVETVAESFNTKLIVE